MIIAIDCDYIMVDDSLMRDYNRKIKGIWRTLRDKIIVRARVQRWKDTSNMGFHLEKLRKYFQRNSS